MSHPTRGMNILGAPGGASRQEGRQLVRVATSIGLPPTSTGQDIVEAIAGSLALPPVDPVVVDDAPCFENTATGDDVDLNRLPVPFIHHGDGGRYLNTWGCIVARTPDGSWTNWSIARMMLVDGKRMSGIVAPQQHIGMIAKAWADIGRPMPFALALGVEPAIPFICGMPLPDRIDESGRLGALLGRPIKHEPGITTRRARWRNDGRDATADRGHRNARVDARRRTLIDANIIYSIRRVAS